VLGAEDLELPVAIRQALDDVSGDGQP